MKQQLKYKISDLRDQLDIMMENEISDKMLETAMYITANKDTDINFALRLLVDNVKNITLDYVKLKSG